MNLYRASYSTQGGTIRRMTFSAACDSDAREYADMLRLSDTVASVETLRECERPVFNLTEEVTQ